MRHSHSTAAEYRFFLLNVVPHSIGTVRRNQFNAKETRNGLGQRKKRRGKRNPWFVSTEVMNFWWVFCFTATFVCHTNIPISIVSNSSIWQRTGSSGAGFALVSISQRQFHFGSVISLIVMLWPFHHHLLSKSEACQMIAFFALIRFVSTVAVILYATFL